MFSAYQYPNNLTIILLEVHLLSQGIFASINSHFIRVTIQDILIISIEGLEREYQKYNVLSTEDLTSTKLYSNEMPTRLRNHRSE